MKNIKIKTLFILPLLVIVIVVINVTRNNNNNKVSPKNILPFIPLPTIPNNLNGQVSVQTSIKKADFNLPDKAPILTQKTKGALEESEVAVIANKLGFSNKLIKANDPVNGQTNIWNDSKASLVIYLRLQKIEFSLNNIQKSANKQVDDNSRIKIAEDYLSKNGVTNTGDLEFVSFQYLSLDSKKSESIQITTKEKADIIQINFSPKTGDFPVLSFSEQNTPIYVWLGLDGEVKKFSVQRFGEITKSDVLYPLITYQDIINSLTSAVVVSLDNGNAYLQDIPSGVVQNINITEIKLAYLLDKPDSQILQPIFILKGMATLETDNKISATLYLPAIKN